MDDNTCTEAGSDRLSVISGTTHGTDEFDSPRWQTGLLKMFQGSDAKDVFQGSPVIGFAGKKSLNQNEYLFEGDTSQETTAPVDDNDDVMSSVSESLLSHQNIPFTNSNAPVSSQTWRKGMGTRGDNSQSRQVKGHNSDWMDHSQGTQFSPSILHVSQMQQSFKTSLPNEGSVLSGFNEEEVDLLHKCQNRLKDIKILLNTSSNNHQDVMVKIGETQGLIIQGLETLHSSNGAISSDWKTCFETLKGHLGQIRQAHDVKREQLALQVKQRGQTKDKRQKIHKELLSLSMQQKSLLNLFQKQQDINKLMKSCIQTAQSSDLSLQKTLSSRSSPVSDPRSSLRSHSNSRSVPRSRSSLTKSPLTLSGSSRSSPSVTKSAQNEKLPNEDLKKKREEESQAEWNTIMGISASTTDMIASKLGDKEKAFSRGFDSETRPIASETRNWVHVRCSSGLKTNSGTPADLDTTAVKCMENVKNTMVVTGVGLKRKTAGLGAEGQQDTKPPQHAVICAHALHGSEKKKCLNPEGIQVSGNLLPGKCSEADDVIVVQPSQKQPVHVGSKEMKSATSANIGRGVTGCESAVMKSATSGNIVGQSVAWCETAVMMSAKSQSQDKMLCTNRKESSMESNSVLVSPGSRTLTGSTGSKQPEELGYQQLESTFAQTKSSITNLPQTGPMFKSSTDTASLIAPKVLPSSDIRFQCTDSVLQTAAVGSKQTLSYPNVTPYKVLPKVPGRKNNRAPHSYASKVLPEKQSHAQVSGGDQVNSAAEMSGNDGCSGMRQVQSAGCKPHGTETSQIPCVLTFPAHMKSSEFLSTRLDSVMELMEKGLLRSGQGNLTLTIKGVCHRGSVMQDGRIHSREGTFKTPTGWVSKVTGVKVKKQAAYDTVMFKGVPLSKLRTASVPSGVSGEEGTETCKDTPGDYGITSAVSHLCGVSSGNSAVGNESQEPVRWRKFLVNCKVCLVSDHELALSESFLDSDFWTENFQRCHLSEELWDSITEW